MVEKRKRNSSSSQPGSGELQADKIAGVDIPVEIFGEILSHLRFTANEFHTKYWRAEARATLRAACLVKVFHSAATALLYETIVAGSFAYEVPYLLRTLLKRPDLARHVHYLGLHDSYDGVRRNESQVTRDSQVAKEVRTSAEYHDTKWSLIPPGCDDSSYRNFSSGENNLIILLALCTSIRELSISMEKYHQLLSENLAEVVGRKERHGKYPKLKMIRLEQDPCHGTLIEFGSMLQMPSLESFKGKHLSTGDCVLKPKYYMNTIKKAEFHDSAFNARGLEGLLACSPELRSLMIEWPNRICLEGNELKFDAVGEVLRNHGTRLEHLDLRAQNAYCLRRGPKSGPFGDLHPLSSLRFFGAAGTAFFDYNRNALRKISYNLDEILPHSLETFALYNTINTVKMLEWRELLGNLVRLTQNESFSKLKKIVVTWELPKGSKVKLPYYEGMVVPQGWSVTAFGEKESRKKKRMVHLMTLEKDGDDQ